METLRNVMTSHCKKLQHKFADVCPACTKRAQRGKKCCRSDFKPQGLETIFWKKLEQDGGSNAEIRQDGFNIIGIALNLHPEFKTDDFYCSKYLSDLFFYLHRI